MAVLAVLAATSEAIAEPPPAPSLKQGNKFGFKSGGDLNPDVDIGFGNHWRSENSTRGNFMRGEPETFGSMVVAGNDQDADFAVYHDINPGANLCGAVPTAPGSDVSLQCGLGLFFKTTNGFTVTDAGGLLSYSSEGATVLWSSATQDTIQTFTILADDNEVCRVVTVTLEGGVTNTKIADGECANTDETDPTVTLTGPEELVTDDFTVTMTFIEDVENFIVDDVTVVNGTKGTFTPVSAMEYTLVISPDLGTTLSVSVAAGVATDLAGNDNEASNVFVVAAGSVASTFEERKDDIRQIILDDARRGLNSTIASNRQMSTEARNRLLENRRQGAQGDTGIASRNNVPFDVDGFAEASGGDFVTKGTFFGQTGNFEGTQRRLVFGDFDIQRDEDTGSSTATLTGRIAWEQMISDETLLGYFVGGELAKSTIDGTFEGEQTRVGATAGGYMVHAFTDGLIANGFVTLGAGRNNLDIADDVLAVEGDYTSRTATIGGAFTGIYSFERIELRPEIAASYGKTWLGDIGMTGTAYGLTDNTITLDAGTVSQANLTLRSEFIYGLDADTVADSFAQISFAPRLICERTVSSTTTEDCGAGAEIGLTGSTEDGLTSANFRIALDRVGNSDRSSFGLSLQHQF